MIQLSSPRRVTPPSCTVPVFSVQYSRIVLPSPITSAVGSPAYFLSCGMPPMAANEKMRLSRPVVVWPSITAGAPMLVPSPIFTCACTTAYGPMVTFWPSCAPGSTIAVGWMVAIAERADASGDRAHRAGQFGLDGDLLADQRACLELEDAGLHAAQRRLE